MDGVTPSVRVVVRVLTAGALLAGLFLMHGLVAGEVTGCPGGIRVMATSVMPSAPAMADAGGAPVVTVPHTGGHGEVCVSTPARFGLAGLLVLAGIGLAVLAPAVWLRLGGSGASAPAAAHPVLVPPCW